MNTRTSIVAALIALMTCTAAHAAFPCFSPIKQARQIDFERAMAPVPNAERLRELHEAFCAEPHVAGTPGDARLIDRLVKEFEDAGLETERHEFYPYLGYPESASLEIVRPRPMSLALIEKVIGSDPDTAHPERPIGFNAFSGSGTVEAEIVYANYGTKADFETLAERGVDLNGKIVIARYGGNYRGYKAKFAEEAGAAGLIMYTDPADAGYARGRPYPEGGFANETSIQRGSIKTLNYAGDPLTPFREATETARRVDADRLPLPKIPVQPIGWGAAERILSLMTGREIPADLHARWQGGLPFAYRLEGGSDLVVRLSVQAERKIVKTANVIGRVTGAKYPDQLVILGCHHDAWGPGASDPVAGLITLVEAARAFGEAAKAGFRADRTVVFAAWGAEEMGIIGSTEWCEANLAQLEASGIAYINLDMAAMGPNFRSSAAPLLKDIITIAAASVPQAGKPSQPVIYDWSSSGTQEPTFGNLGGGSDHVGFYLHAGVPSCSLGAGGSFGTAYHTNYDTVRWYRRVVGDDYQSALMITRLATCLAARLANADIIPYSPTRYARDTRQHINHIRSIAVERNLPGALFVEMFDQLDRLEPVMDEAWAAVLKAVETGSLTPTQTDDINAVLLSMERAWIVNDGLPMRPWYRNSFAATDPDSGYGAWMLPLARSGAETGNDSAIRAATLRYAETLIELRRMAENMHRIVDPGRSAAADPDRERDGHSHGGR